MPADNWMACTSAAGASYSIVLQSQAAILLGVVGVLITLLSVMPETPPSRKAQGLWVYSGCENIMIEGLGFHGF